MINFIDKNPTTEAINANETRDLREAQVANSLLTARDQRRATAAKDRIGRGIASIFADAAPTSTTPSSGETVAPIGAGTAQVMPAQPPQGDGMLAPATPTAQTYSVEQPKPVSALATVAPSPAADAMPKRSLLASFPGQQSDPYRRAVQYAAGQEGGGELALQLANKQSEREPKRADLAHAEAIKAFGQGDFELAKALNQRHGLGLDSVFGNPSALQASRILAKSIEHLKLEPAQTVAYMDAAAQKYAETRDMNQAGMAGITAARGARPKGTGNLVETPDGYYNRDTGDYEKGKDGKALRVPDRRLFFDPNRGSLTQAQERSNIEIDAARARIAALDPAEVRRRSQKATNTGRENPDYDPSIAREAALASRRKVGTDEFFDSRQGQTPTATRVAPVQSRFASDPTMKGHKMGRRTPDGYEVFDASGKLIGHYH